MLVFEDLHWADENLLDFVDHLVDWATGVPLLVVCTARPELLARRPGWGGGKPNALTISLSPLSDEETARLLGELLERSVLPADTQAELLARAGGNPLYAEEFARTLRERGRIEQLPETVQGMIAARLDLLELEQKTADPGRRRCRQGVLAWRSRAARGRASAACSRSGSTRSSGRSSCGASEPLRWPATPSTPSGTCSFVTSPTGRSHEPSAPRSTAARRSGSSSSGGPTITRRCSPITICKRSSWALRPVWTQERSPGRRRLPWPTPAIGRSRSTPTTRPAATTAPHSICSPEDDTRHGRLLLDLARALWLVGEPDVRLIRARPRRAARGRERRRGGRGGDETCGAFLAGGRSGRRVRASPPRTRARRIAAALVRQGACNRHRLPLPNARGGGRGGDPLGSRGAGDGRGARARRRPRGCPEQPRLCPGIARG